MSRYNSLLLAVGVKEGDLHDSSEKQPNAVQLLNHLLETKALSPEQVKSAWYTLQMQSVESVGTIHTPKKTIKTDPPAPNDREPDNCDSNALPHRTRHVALKVYYDGEEYAGLAQNMGKDSDQSVEKALFSALLKTRLVQSRETSRYSRCGRTDKGVSAAGQVVALHLKSAVHQLASFDEDGQSPVNNDALPRNSLDAITIWVPPKKGEGPKTQKSVTEYSYAKMLNNVLPDTIRVLGWSPVSSDFSARFSANARTYRYFFVRRNLNLEKMSEALQMMVGRHDFRNFCKMDVEKVYNFERQIHSAQIVEPSSSASSQKSDACYLEILGQAFLWHQIRCIASVLFLVGQGLECPSVVEELLNVAKYPGKPSYPLAAERPLVLHSCGYPNLRMGYAVQNLWTVTCQMEQQWEDLILAAARVRNCLEDSKHASVTTHDVHSFVKARLQERRKKQRKTKGAGNLGESALQDLDIDAILAAGSVVSWGEAIAWMANRALRPDPFGARENVHVPLLQRSCGTTYEEKIQALSKSQKRRERYEENVVKKRKTQEEDAAFYEHMARQGGAGI